VGDLLPAAYQLVPLTKLLTNDQRALLICDGVGVGKTIGAGYILTFLINSTGRPGLVICPASLQEKWFFELRTKFRLHVLPIRSGEEFDLTVDHWNRPGDNPPVYVLPMSVVTRVRSVQFLGPVIIDEIHNCRNHDTQLWKSVKALTKYASYRTGLSATPINNGVSDLSSIFSILVDTDYHVADALVQDLWRPHKRHLLYSLMTRFLKERLSLHFARRNVHDLHVQFPDPYLDQVISTVKALRDRPRNNRFYRDEITYLRLGTSSPRAFMASTGIAVQNASEKKDTLLNILRRHRSEPVLVFCEFEETTKEVAAAILDRPSFLMTGSTAVFDRENIIVAFRQTVDGILVMTSVGAEGIDLQFCSTLVNYDLTWNPMVLEQRIGRVDRIGQRKDVINIYNFIVSGSIDERIITTLGRKLCLVEGSVLEPATVLQSASNSKPLFFDETLHIEQKRAESLSRTIDFSGDIIPEDYSVLTAIDIEYCDSNILRDSALADTNAIRWLKTTEEGRNWRERLLERSQELKGVVDFYRN
jgi:SNF2 family DNA or RNA helicase